MIIAGDWCYYLGKLFVVISTENDRAVIVNCLNPKHHLVVEVRNLITEDDAVKNSTVPSKLHYDLSTGIMYLIYN